MSGLYLPNMEMPEDEVIAIYLYPNGKAHIWRKTSAVGEELYAIPVPNHGRLGDLDAMAQDEMVAYISAQEKLGHDVIGWQVNTIVHAKIQKLIEDTPTIISSTVESEDQNGN